MIIKDGSFQQVCYVISIMLEIEVGKTRPFLTVLGGGQITQLRADYGGRLMSSESRTTKYFDVGKELQDVSASPSPLEGDDLPGGRHRNQEILGRHHLIECR